MIGFIGFRRHGMTFTFFQQTGLAQSNVADTRIRATSLTKEGMSIVEANGMKTIYKTRRAGSVLRCLRRAIAGSVFTALYILLRSNGGGILLTRANRIFRPRVFTRDSRLEGQHVLWFNGVRGNIDSWA